MNDVSLPHIVIELESKNLLPAIVFRSSRNQCDEDVENVASNKKLLLTFIFITFIPAFRILNYLKFHQYRNVSNNILKIT